MIPFPFDAVRDRHTEHLASLALTLNLSKNVDDEVFYDCIARINDLREADMVAVLAACDEMAMLFLKLALMLAARK